MKFAATTVLLGLAATAAAQSGCDAVAAKVPSCAKPCINSAAESAGCGPMDYACQCKPDSASAIQAAAQSCVLKGCGDEALGVIASASAVCDCVATAKDSAPSTSAPASGLTTSAAAEPTGSAAAAPGSGGATGGASLPTVGASSSYAVPSSSAAVAASASGPVGTGGMMPSNTIVPFTGGAATVVGSFGGVMAAMLAVIAAL